MGEMELPVQYHIAHSCFEDIRHTYNLGCLFFWIKPGALADEDIVSLESAVEGLEGAIHVQDAIGLEVPDGRATESLAVVEMCALAEDIRTYLLEDAARRVR